MRDKEIKNSNLNWSKILRVGELLQEDPAVPTSSSIGEANK